jgi:uncharacterized protein YjcR
VFDFVRVWSEKTETPNRRIPGWIGVRSSKLHDWKRRFGWVNEHNACVPRDHWLTKVERERIVVSARRNPLEGY